MLALGLQRTPEELKKPEFNYFIVFKIDLRRLIKL